MNKTLIERINNFLSAIPNPNLGDDPGGYGDLWEMILNAQTLLQEAKKVLISKDLQLVDPSQEEIFRKTPIFDDDFNEIL